MSSVPSIDTVLLAARNMPGLGCFDTGLRTTVVTWGSGPIHLQNSGWQQFVREYCRPTASSSHVFCGGVIGWLGYEAGATVERMPTPSGPRPTHDVCLWRTDGALTFDHIDAEWSIQGSPSFRTEAHELLKQASTCTNPEIAPQDMPAWRPTDHQQRSSHFTDGVRSILQAIHAGDVYQVNLSWEQTGIPIDDGIRTWLELRKQNPALRGCYLCQGDVEILSNSPELFLHVDGASRRAISIPIKGTVPLAGGEPAKQHLLESPKERAELTMIVDLVRNDLGRVATPGTVETSERSLRRCGDLWHAEQAVQADLKPGIDVVDAFCAAFPPGSVTGAPKVRAMEIIRTLEDQPRGIYTGAIGWFADGGSAHFNVAIRTATLTKGMGRFHVGAGIVADSQPDLEWSETLSKAGAMAHCLEAE